MLWTARWTWQLHAELLLFAEDLRVGLENEESLERLTGRQLCAEGVDEHIWLERLQSDLDWTVNTTCELPQSATCLQSPVTVVGPNSRGHAWLA